MADGIRIQHPTARSVTFTITDANRPYPAPLTCMAEIIDAGARRPCARVHVAKTYHLNLDESGAAVVSTTVAERLGRIPGQPFRHANVVAEPPHQTIFVPTLTLRPRAAAPGV